MSVETHVNGASDHHRSVPSTQPFPIPLDYPKRMDRDLSEMTRDCLQLPRSNRTQWNHQWMSSIRYKVAS